MVYQQASQTWQSKRVAEVASSINEPDFMAVWLDCDTYIQFVQEVLSRTDLQMSITQDIRMYLELLQRRRNDRNLYIAVVGEFNSGKSTFINALLRRELLKQSPVVRTAVPTKICYANTSDIQVLFAGENQPLSYEQQRERLKQKLRLINAQVSLPTIDNLRDYLHLITTDPKIAPSVREVTVFQPASFLEQNIVIIDTPGTNARDVNHIKITRRVIEHDADAVVITIPATAALSGKLAEFMQTDLQPFLHRCLPVVTRLDQLDSETEQRMVLNDLRDRLPEIVNGQQLKIYEAAPQIMLDVLKPGKMVPPNLQYWQVQFVELERAIWDRLCYERTVSISESLLRIMTRLLTDLEAYLSQQQRAYVERQQAIEREKIPNIVEFANNEIESISDVFTVQQDLAANKIVEVYKEVRQEALKQLSDGLQSASSDSDFESFVTVQTRRILTEAGDNFNKELKKYVNKFQEKVNDVAHLSEARFTEAYQRLEEVGEVQLSGNTGIGRADFSISAPSTFSYASQVTTDINNQEGALMGGGMVAGGVIGQVLIPIPVVGAVIGGFIGAAVGAMFVSTDRKREKIAEALSPEIAKFFDQLIDKAGDAFGEHISQLGKHIERKLQDYIEQYGEIMLLVQQQQEEEQEKLEQLQQTVEADLQEIRRRHSLLQQKQQQLKAKLFS